MLTIRRFQKGDEEILSVMIRRTLREVNYTSPKSELDYLIPHYSPETMVELSETGHTYVLEEDGQIIGSGTDPAGWRDRGGDRGGLPEPGEYRQGLWPEAV